LTARVVQHITGPVAEQLGGSCALALEVLELEGERKRQLAQLLDFARAQQSGKSSPTSFTHSLLEATPSLPPREVGLRLSQLPRSGASGLRQPPSPAAATAPAQQEESGYRHTAALRSRRDDITRPLSPARARAQIGGSQPAQAEAAPRSDSAETATAADPRKLKVLLSNIAHKQYDLALRVADEILAAAPNEPQARRWRAICCARLALSRNDVALAVQAYEGVLELDPNDREASDYLRTHARTKKLDSLPFGRFFVKKK
jgi:tetratricopeptide (TPR) repeat protein